MGIEWVLNGHVLGNDKERTGYVMEIVTSKEQFHYSMEAF